MRDLDQFACARETTRSQTTTTDQSKVLLNTFKSVESKKNYCNRSSACGMHGSLVRGSSGKQICDSFLCAVYTDRSKRFSDRSQSIAKTASTNSKYRHERKCRLQHIQVIFITNLQVFLTLMCVLTNCKIIVSQAFLVFIYSGSTAKISRV